MSFGEWLTKLAVILTCYAAAQDCIWSIPVAWKLGGTLLALSLLRDANLRWREAVRMFPGFGFWFCVTAALVCLPNAVLKKLIGSESWGLTYWGSIFAAGFIAICFRGYVICCESFSRWTMWSLGFDNRRLDAAHRYLMGGANPYETIDEDEDSWPVTVVEGTVERCPECDEPLAGANRCEMCGLWLGKRIGRVPECAGRMPPLPATSQAGSSHE